MQADTCKQMLTAIENKTMDQCISTSTLLIGTNLAVTGLQWFYNNSIPCLKLLIIIREDQKMLVQFITAIRRPLLKVKV